jgi:hypothetical protein
MIIKNLKRKRRSNKMLPTKTHNTKGHKKVENKCVKPSIRINDRLKESQSYKPNLTKQEISIPSLWV